MGYLFNKPDDPSARVVVALSVCIAGLFIIFGASKASSAQSDINLKLSANEQTICEVVGMNLMVAVKDETIDIDEAGQIMYRCINNDPGIPYSEYHERVNLQEAK